MGCFLAHKHASQEKSVLNLACIYMKKGEAQKLKNKFQVKIKDIRLAQLAVAKKYFDKKSSVKTEIIRKKITSM